MSAILQLNLTWEHTLIEILNHDPKSQMSIKIREWVKDNDMENFRAMLAYTADKFTPTGSLCYFKDKADPEKIIMMPTTPLQELYNLRRYITHVMNESDYDPDDPDFDHPLSEHNWLSQTRGNKRKLPEICHLYFIRWYRDETNILPKTKIGQFQDRYKKGGNCLSYT